MNEPLCEDLGGIGGVGDGDSELARGSIDRHVHWVQQPGCRDEAHVGVAEAARPLDAEGPGDTVEAGMEDQAVAADPEADVRVPAPRVLADLESDEQVAREAGGGAEVIGSLPADVEHPAGDVGIAAAGIGEVGVGRHCLCRVRSVGREGLLENDAALGARR